MLNTSSTQKFAKSADVSVSKKERHVEYIVDTEIYTISGRSVSKKDRHVGQSTHRHVEQIVDTEIRTISKRIDKWNNRGHIRLAD
jgi:hypothetical protein